MRLKKYLSIILIFALIYLLSGCDKSHIQASNNHKNNKKLEVIISPEINKYSPLISSTPGIPLTVNFIENKASGNMKFHWITEEGTFLNWHQANGKIKDLGKDIKINNQKIYWSMDPNSKINKASFKIHLKVEDTNTSKEISNTSIEVEQNKEGAFSINT